MDFWMELAKNRRLVCLTTYTQKRTAKQLCSADSAEYI